MKSIYAYVYPALKFIQERLILIPRELLVKIILISFALSVLIKYMLFSGTQRNLLLLDDFFSIIIMYVLLNYELPEPK